MSKQVQQRGDTSTNLGSTVPAAREMAVNTTRNRLHIGDGSTSGGIPHANFLDMQENTFSYGSAGGTGNALTLTLSPAPSTYVAGQRFIFKATASNTGAATLNVNSLGTRNIYKRSGGTIGAVASNDILNGGIYEVVYDGTQFQLTSTEAATAILSVSQGDLNTSTGSVSATGAYVVLPGGEYGFFPQVRSGVSNTNSMAVMCSTSNSFVTGILLGADTDASNQPTFYSPISNYCVPSLRSTSPDVGYAQQRYITSSPPFDLGDGEVGGFLFLLLNSSGDTVAHYSADVPPWAYNGPTDIKSVRRDPMTGKKYRRKQMRSLKELMDGATPEYSFEEITHQIKNADMDLIPHPFGIIPDDYKVVLVDPMDNRLRKLIEYQNIGGINEIAEEIMKGKIYADNEKINGRKGPKHVMQCGLRFKYGG